MEKHGIESNYMVKGNNFYLLKLQRQCSGKHKYALQLMDW